MADYMIRATAAEGQIRAFAVTSKELVEEARKRHNTSPIVTAALGRLMSGAVMMGSMMKGEKDLLTIRVNGDGPMRGMTVTADAAGNVKGYPFVPDVVLPANALGKLDVAGAIGAGNMSVIKDMGMKEPYVGQTQLVSGEIAEDLTYYYATSEQINSSVALGVLMEKNNTVKQAGGFILQLMPFTEDAVIDKLEENVKKLPSVTTMLEEGETPEGMIRRVLDGFDVEFYEETPTGYVCDCSKERVERAIISIGKKEIQDMIDDQKPIEVNCHFCGRHYEFSVDDLKHLLKKAVRA